MIAVLNIIGTVTGNQKPRFCFFKFRFNDPVNRNHLVLKFPFIYMCNMELIILLAPSVRSISIYRLDLQWFGGAMGVE